jgi:hypothetical protein
MTEWDDTPNRLGLLPTAVADAKIAEEQAYMADLEGRLNDFILFSGYVLYALDPGAETKALLETAYARLPATANRVSFEPPGSGYGVKKASSGALKHVKLVAESEDATEEMKTHVLHVSASLENVVNWTDQAIATARKILVATTASEGQPLITELEALTLKISNGLDANSDDRISCLKGEGGLLSAETHMKLIMKGL